MTSVAIGCMGRPPGRGIPSTAIIMSAVMQNTDTDAKFGVIMLIEESNFRDKFNK